MVYIINALLILFWNLVIPSSIAKKKKILCVFYCLQWILLSGFRAYSVGADTYAYKVYNFDKTFNKSWAEVFANFVDYCRGVDGIKDPAYMLFEKICQIFIGNNYTLFLFIIAIIFTVPMTVWLYKYSDNVCLSFMIYSALFYSFFAITGHRQTIASALVIFAGYECMKKNKIFPLLFVHLVAFFIHKSSICFIILYFARFIKINKWYWVVSTIFIALSFVLRNQLMSLLGNFMGYEQYIEQFEGAGAYRFTAFLLTIYVGVMITYFSLPKDVDTQYSVVALTLAVFFTPLTFVDPNAMRVVQYFSIFIMILIPRVLAAFDKNSQICIEFGCYAVLLCSILIGAQDYTFIFWA